MATEQTGHQDYNEYNQWHEYTQVPGVMQVPVASRTSAHRLIRLHGGYGTRIVKWRASRFGRPPVIPAAAGTTDDTLLGTTVTPTLPSPNEQAGGFDWSVSGEYRYAQNEERVPGTDAFPVGQHPFVNPIQEQIATGLTTQISVSPSDFNAFYTAVGTAVYDAATGAYLWPFLALAPAFSSEDLI